jgi:hypothetical protein
MPVTICSPHVTEWMRLVCLDWVSELCESWLMSRQTFMQAAELLDFALLHATQVRGHNLQGLAAACLMLATRYEEVWRPEETDVVSAGADTFTLHDMLGWEQWMLKQCRFCPPVPTTLQGLKTVVGRNQATVSVLCGDRAPVAGHDWTRVNRRPVIDGMLLAEWERPLLHVHFPTVLKTSLKLRNKASV